MKKLWHWIVALFSVLLGLFFYERNRRKTAEGKLDNAEYKKEDAVLAERQNHVEADIQEQKKKIEEMKNAEVAEDPTKDLTPEERESYWRRRFGPPDQG